MTSVIVGFTISRGSFVFSQSRVKVSASLINVGSLAIGAFDLVNCSLFVVGFDSGVLNLRFCVTVLCRVPVRCASFSRSVNFSSEVSVVVV